MWRLLFVMLFSLQCFAQVGINTSSPAIDAALDIDGNEKGVLIPRVDIIDLSTIAPVTGGSTESLLVYNTNIVTGKGFYYWSGVRWVPVGDGVFWNKNGNAGTTPGTSLGQNYLGTTDATDLVIATNATEALRVTAGSQIIAASAGSPSQPTFTFSSAPGTGMYSSGTASLNFSSSGTDLLELNSGVAPGIRFNKTQANIDTRIASQNNVNMVYVDASANRMGIGTNSPQAALHIAGASSSVRIDALNSTNNINNEGMIATPVFVDANGELNLQGSNALTQLVIDDQSFLSTPITVDHVNSATRTEQLLYTTTVSLTRDALIEVVYQAGVTISNADSSNSNITDGKPRIFRIFALVDGKRVAYKGDSYTSSPSTTGTIVNGPFYLNGNGYVQLTGAVPATVHTIQIYAEVFGYSASTRCIYGGNGDDLIQVLVRY